MNYSNHVLNSSVVLNKEGSCEINCPGCSFGIKKRDINNKLSISDIKKRIDFAALNFSDGYSLILLPGNVLLEYTNEEMENILEYASLKHKIIQWEIEKLDERILKIFNSEKIIKLLKDRKLFLNIGYVAGKIDVLKKVYNKLCILGRENFEKKIKNENLLKYLE